MRVISFRYRFECEFVDVEKQILEHYFVSIIMPLNEIEKHDFKKVYDTPRGEVKILNVIAKDQFAEYIDEACIELYENDKCMDELERIGYIVFKNAQFVFEIEDSKETIPLEKCYWHIRKIGTRFGDDSGEVRRYDLKGFEEIL